MPNEIPPAFPRIGESHRVVIAEVESIDSDHIVRFRDLDRPHRHYDEWMSASEFDGLSIGSKGSITLRPSRLRREGRWAFEPDQVEADATA